jgi:hypothetical protein
MGIEARRFLYATRAGAAGAETLRLGEMNLVKGRAKPSARAVKAVATLPGAQPSGEVPETWQRLVPSPGNKRIAALSEQFGLNFVDHNIRVVDMATGTALFFNEHRFSQIGRATWGSALFDAFLAAEAAIGVPPADLAGYDWRVELEGGPGANIPAPEIAWADDDTLVVGFKLLVIANGQVELGEELFRFRLAAADGFGAFAAWTGSLPPPPPTSKLSLSGPPTPGTILYAGEPLRFTLRGLPLPWWPILTNTRKAILVGGLVS